MGLSPFGKARFLSRKTTQQVRKILIRFMLLRLMDLPFRSLPEKHPYTQWGDRLPIKKTNFINIDKILVEKEEPPAMKKRILF